MSEIVQIRRGSEFGLRFRDILGLNVLIENQVSEIDANSPITTFLKALSETIPCSAHTGNLADKVDTAEEAFGLPSPDHQYEIAAIGIYNSNFYDALYWSSFPACFFPRIGPGFWEMKTKYGASTIRELLDYDALALYAGADDGALSKMEMLLKNVYSSNDDWLMQVAEIYRLIVISCDDGAYFSVYAKDEPSYDLLSGALRDAERNVEETNWYKRNVQSLIWSEEDLCLMLPKKK